ncbi:phage major capsid protein [Sphingosinicella sp. BN140058]|uniref:phage major capsid protein n=1 Tax=Sphingosinicella sp. BN140058 TaxID=1892855 RepID=UPI001011A611|nr:phage major capsid protein [Sphingosinicella sp. BN140058]QAY77916.1 phage major capsid protein [Sphingosinicella sp. BN140058]
MKIRSLLAAAFALAATFLVVLDPAAASAGDLLSLTGLGALVATGAGGSARLAMSALERRMGRFMRGPDGHDTKTAAELAAEVKTAFQAQHDAVKAIAEEALGKANAGETLTTGLKEKADEALTKLNELKARVEDAEQKLARRITADDNRAQSAGERFVNDEGFKSFAGQTRPRGRYIAEVKDITSLTTDAAGSAGALIQTDRRGLVAELPQRRMTVRALLAPGTTASSSIEYDREKVFTNNAAPVAEGVTKPQSELQFEDATATVRTIAHWMRTSVQILADAPGLRSIIDQRLRYGLAFVEEGQLLNGSGTGQNLPGLVTNATAYAAPGSLVASTPVDVVRLMILQVALAEYPANGVVMNPIDMAAIEMSKDAAGAYLIGDPQGTIQKRLWGLPVVETQAIGVDKALVGAFDLAAQIFDRQDATVEVSTEDQDNFVKNKVTIRAEERLALAIYRPQAIVYGDLGRVP